MLGVLLPAGPDPELVADSLLTDATWLSESTWLGGDGAAGLDDILLGADLLDEGNGS